MGRGEMIRRLDDGASAVASLGTGPLTADERHALADTLGKLLPLVADSLQEQLDAEAAAALQPSPERRSLADVKQSLAAALEHITQLEQAVNSRDVIGQAK